MGTFIAHIPCPHCGSSDAGARYDDGSAHCFACDRGIKGADGEGLPQAQPSAGARGDFIQGACQEITDRKIKADICRKYGYQVGEHKGQPVHIANYRNLAGELVAQKLRGAGKAFSILGVGKDMPLFGQQLYSGGKSVVVTEGELDALAVSQAFNGQWAAVSLPNGAPSAVKAIQNAFEWLSGFDKIVLCFDQDAQGLKATQDACEALPVGKAFIMTLPRKDASDVLRLDGTAPIVSAYWNAKPWRPDGIIAGAELTKERLKKAAVRGYSVRYPKLDTMLSGFREGELTLLTAGSGIGKSTFARELAYGLHQDHGLTIGNIFLEENAEKTAQGYIALHHNVKLGALRANPELLTEDQWDQGIREVTAARMFFYDHFGSLDSTRLLAKIRYMRSVLKCNFVVLDHISIVVSGQESSSEGERKDIDRLMTALRSLIEETGLGILAIVHLNASEGKPHEEGGRVTLKNLRGSGALKQLSDNVVAMERDQQAEGVASNRSDIRVLKSREFGLVGVTDTVEYDHETGRLNAVESARPPPTNKSAHGIPF